jgi:hypothetical protein
MRYFSIILAVLSPFVLIYCFGEIKSISAYWNTNGQPLFIITNAVTSYFLFSNNRWKIPAFFLLFLTAFSLTLYPILHNIFAMGFFVSSAIAMYHLHRFRFYIIPYLCFGIWAIFHLLYGEVGAILTICVYHIHILIYVKELKK